MAAQPSARPPRIQHKRRAGAGRGGVGSSPAVAVAHSGVRAFRAGVLRQRDLLLHTHRPALTPSQNTPCSFPFFALSLPPPSSRAVLVGRHDPSGSFSVVPPPSRRCKRCKILGIHHITSPGRPAAATPSSSQQQLSMPGTAALCCEHPGCYATLPALPRRPQVRLLRAAVARRCCGSATATDTAAGCGAAQGHNCCAVPRT